MHARVFALLLVFGSVAVATTQEPTTAQIPVRIVATDAKGRDVKNLTPADVEISEGNTGQKIQSLVRAGAGPRKIGILLDEYHVADGEPVQAATAALLRFVEKSVRPDDVVFVMRPLDPAATLVPVKSLDELRKTIGDFAGRKGNYAPRTPFEAEYMSTLPPSVTRQRGQVVRAALQALVTVMNRSEPTGPTVPSALLLVTEGFAAEDRGRDRLTSLRVVARAARMSGIAVYVLDPVPVPPSASPFNEQWQALAAQTGGVLSSGAPLDAALARMATDLESQYVATIAASFKEDGGFHALDVKAKRKDVVVRAPSGYWTPIAAERYTASTRPAMSTYLKTPHVSGLIQPWFRTARAGSGRTRVTFSWVPKGNTKLTPAHVTLSAVSFEGVKLLEADVASQGGTSETRARHGSSVHGRPAARCEGDDDHGDRAVAHANVARVSRAADATRCHARRHPQFRPPGPPDRARPRTGRQRITHRSRPAPQHPWATHARPFRVARRRRHAAVRAPARAVCPRRLPHRDPRHCGLVHRVAAGDLQAGGVIPKFPLAMKCGLTMKS
jgi:VWFA-related protein